MFPPTPPLLDNQGGRIKCPLPSLMADLENNWVGGVKRAESANFFCLPPPKEDFVSPLSTSLAPNQYIRSGQYHAPGGGRVAKTSRGGGQKFETWHRKRVLCTLGTKWTRARGSGELKTAPEALHAHFAYSRNNQIWHIFANSVVLTHGFWNMYVTI